MAEFLGMLGLIFLAVGGIGSLLALYFFTRWGEFKDTDTDEFLPLS